jgi:hypothetical protein
VPYRDGPSEAPCHQCERPTGATCPVCTKPTCDRHLDAKQKMCGRCDEAHYRFMHREDSSGVMVQVMALLAIAIVPAVITTSMLPLTIATVFFGFPGMIWYRGRQARKKFFELMRTRGALPEKPAEFSADDEALAAYQRKVSDRKAETLAASFEPAETDTPDT